MAKAKKPATTAKPATATASAKKKSTTPATTTAPMIDTAQLAVAAAKFIGAKTTAAPSTPARESGSFKELRNSMNNPSAAGSMANALNQSAGPLNKKSNTSHFTGKQVGRNQTFGADVNRAGVPRRTGG